MLSEFQKRKLSYFFGLVDADHNGFVDQSDLAAYGDRVAAAKGLPADAPALQAFREGIAHWWAGMQAHVDHDDDGRLSLGEWFAYWGSFHAHLAEADEEERQVILDGLDVATDENFALHDLDGNGTMDAREFALRLEAAGCPTGHDEAFRHLDTDGDGQLTRDDLRAAAREFWVGDDPAAPGSFYYGPVR